METRGWRVLVWLIDHIAPWFLVTVLLGMMVLVTGGLFRALWRAVS